MEDSKGDDAALQISKTKINIYDFLTFIIIFSNWTISSKIDLLLIMYDMQNIEKISISEMLIIIKSVFRVVSCIKIKGINSKLIDIPDDNLEIFIENTFGNFIQGIVEKLQKESNIPENTTTEGDSFPSMLKQLKVTQSMPTSSNSIGLK